MALTLWSSVPILQVLHALLQNTDLKQGTPVVLVDATAVAASLVGHSRAPVDACGLIANGEDGSGRVEVGHLGREQLANGMKDETADTEQVDPITSLQDAGDLLHLVALNVDPPQDSKHVQLILTGALQLMLSAQHGLVLEKHAASPAGTCKVVDIWAANSVTAVSGARFLAVSAQSSQSTTQGDLHIDEGPPLGLVHLCGPQGTVEVHPQVHINVQQPGGAVRGSVAFLVAEAAFTFVPRQPVGPKSDAQAVHELRNLAAALFLRTPLAYCDDNLKTLPANPLPFFHFGMYHLLIGGERPALLDSLRGRLHVVRRVSRRWS